MTNSLQTSTSSLTGSLDKSEIIRAIQKLVPPGSPEPQDAETLNALQDLTKQLIQAYQSGGALEEDPFADVWGRSIYLYETEVRERLKGKTILVTGGEGCVGKAFIEKLVGLGAPRIISVDNARCSTNSAGETTQDQQGTTPITYYAVDIRTYEDLEKVFQVEKPAIVFHLAAQRLPWLAEIQIRETVTSNIFGTQNIIQLCEAYGVEDCIYSSTGKASRYFTDEVYAASKKVSEWQLARAAKEGKVNYAMVRFTHMLDNSSFCEYFDGKIAQDKTVKVHAPERYIVGQNVTEAMHLLLNALVLLDPDRLLFFLCRNLGWPTETLEVGLYKILQSGKSIPIYFQGLVAGYEEPFFRGQANWSRPTEINTLINVIEIQTQHIDESGDMIVSEVPPFSYDKLDHHLVRLQSLAADLDLPESKIKQGLAEAVKDITGSIFSQISPDLLLQIWKWGFDPSYLQLNGKPLDKYYQTLLELFIEGLFRGCYCQDIHGVKQFLQDALALRSQRGENDDSLEA